MRRSGHRLLAAALSVAAVDAGADLGMGIHVHNSQEIASAAKVGYGHLRLWDSYTAWRDMQPERPQLIRLEELNLRVGIAERNGLKVILTLGSTPTWASMRPKEKCAYGLGCAAPPASMEQWRAYVRVVARTFKGRIECYQIWNEVSFPDDAVLNARTSGGGGSPDFFSGTADQLVALQRAAFEEIKAADPKACVLSPSFHSSGEWFGKVERFLQAGGGAWFDRLSFHFYTGEHPPERVQFYAREVQSVLARFGRGDAEIWNTETGIMFPSNRGQAQQEFRDRVFAEVLRHYLVNFASGIKRVYWYSWDHRDGLGVSRLVSKSGAVSEELARELTTFFSGLQSVECPLAPYVHAPHVGVWHCTLTWQGGITREIAWNTAGADAKASLPSTGREWRLWGRPASEAPLPAGHRLDGRPVVSNALPRR